MKMYPYSYIFKKKRKILIWQSGKKDTFRVDSEGRLVVAENIKTLQSSLGEDSNRVHWNEASEIDFDRFWVVLKNLRTGRASSPKTCSLLLNGWNFIEDMLRTFAMSKEKRRLKSPLLNRAYKKIFYGINLPSITPDNKSYSPLWEHEEILTLRKELSIVWNNLRQSGHIMPRL